ncbi:MAG: DUF4442 domain-containing protein [Propionibacteriaceae bacterium]
MTVRYVAKATTDLRCVADTSTAGWEQADVSVRVTAVRRDGVAAVEGVITIRVSDRRLTDPAEHREAAHRHATVQTPRRYRPSKSLTISTKTSR